MSRFSLLLLISTLMTFLMPGCVAHTRFNQSYLTSEELKPTKNGYVSFNTGETLDITGILLKENNPKNIIFIKTHGKILLTGDGFKNIWRIWPTCSTDEAGYETVKISPSPSLFRNPSMEKSGDCTMIKWDGQSGPQSVYFNQKGQTDVEKCR